MKHILITLNLLVATVCPIAFGAEVISAEDEEQIVEWLEVERAKVTSPEHSSDALLNRNEQGQIIKTPLAVVVIHGLYNSPLWTRDLSEEFYRKGMNVLNIRLPGHFEASDPRALDKVSIRDWERSVEADFERALLVGEKVILVGHSLGGLLGTRIAIEREEQIAGLVLLAPAFQTSFNAIIKSTISSLVGYHQTANRQSIQERYVSGKPALRVAKLFKKLYRQGRSRNKLSPIEGLGELLTNVPTLVVNTAIEKAIDIPSLLKTVEALKEKSNTPKFHVMLDRELQVPHREMATPSEMNKGYDQLLSAIDMFLKAI